MSNLKPEAKLESSESSNQEIERRFLVNRILWDTFRRSRVLPCALIKQGYLSTNPVSRIRIIEDETNNIEVEHTIKGPKVGITAPEFNTSYPADYALEVMKLCEHQVVKHRYTFKYFGKTWVVDEFRAENRGLLIAEIELSREDEKFRKPKFIDAEVTALGFLSNAALAKHPFQSWGATYRDATLSRVNGFDNPPPNAVYDNAMREMTEITKQSKEGA